MKAQHTTPYPGQTATVTPTLVGTLQTPAHESVQEVRTAPSITVEHLSTLTEWLYWQRGWAAAHLRWTFSAGGALVTLKGEHDEPAFVILIAANGEPLVKTESLKAGSLGTGRRYAWREILQDIADRIAEKD